MNGSITLEIRRWDAITLATCLNNDIEAMKAREDAIPELAERYLNTRIPLMNKLIKECELEEIFKPQSIEGSVWLKK